VSEETVVEVKEVPIDTATNMQDYKKARAEGKSTVEQKVAPEVEESKPEEDKSEVEKPKAKGGFQKRIDNLVKHNATLENELEQLRTAAKGAPKEEVKTAPVVEGEPQRDKFNSESDYVRALTRWEVKQEIKKQAEADAKADFEANEHKIVTTYNERVSEAKSRYEDWNDVVSQEVNIPSAVGRTILLMKNGPDVAYYLGSNAEAREELLSLDPLEAVGRAWEISKELSTKEDSDESDDVEVVEEEKPAKLVSKAPPPIKPVGTGSATRSTVPLDKTTSMRDFKQRRAAGQKH
jgi:hypothetical protein